MSCFYFILVLLSCSTTCPTSTIASVGVKCVSTVSGAGYSVALGPSNTTSEADSGVDVVFTDLNPDTTYTYTARLTGVGDVDYAVNGTVTTPNITTPTTVTLTVTILGKLPGVCDICHIPGLALLIAWYADL